MSRVIGDNKIVFTYYGKRSARTLPREEANENNARESSPVLSLATSATTIERDAVRTGGRAVGRGWAGGGRCAAFTRKTADKTNRYVDVNIIRDLLLIQPPVTRQPSIQVNLIYVLKFYSIDCTLDSPDFREPLPAILDIFHRVVGLSLSLLAGGTENCPRRRRG